MEHYDLENKIKRLLSDTSFEGQLQRFYSKVIKPGDIVVDVGAHSGRHTLPFSFLVGEFGRVIAVEANPEAIANLKSQLYHYKLNNVDVYNFALSNQEKSDVDFFVAVDCPEESGLRLRKIYNKKNTNLNKVKIEARKLDLLNIGGKVNFIKIDVEGAEYDVLQGAYNTIVDNKPIITFEFGKNSYEPYGVDPEEVYEFFYDLRYEILSINGDPLSCESFITSSCVQEYWDYIACPNDLTGYVQSLIKQAI